MQGGGHNGGFGQWTGLSPGQLMQEIKAAFAECPVPGEYWALVLRCESQVSKYKVHKDHAEGQKDGFKCWKDLTPGHLMQEIEAAFRNCNPGDYYALVLQCENPISGYKVVKIPI